MYNVTNEISRDLSPELKGRLEERARSLSEAVEAETMEMLKQRQARRAAVLDTIEARWPQMPMRPSAGEVDEWANRWL